MHADLIIKRPIITEKSMRMAAKGVYTFLVDTKAGKHQIAEQVAKQFKVTVEEVSTVSIPGKVRRFGKRRFPAQLSDQKKAMVQVKKGDTIGLFDISTEESK